MAVSGIIVEAQRFAEGLKSKAVAENKELISKNELAAKQVAQDIKAWEDKLTIIRSDIQQVLTDTDDKLNKIQQELLSLHEQA